MKENEIKRVQYILSFEFVIFRVKYKLFSVCFSLQDFSNISFSFDFLFISIDFQKNYEKVWTGGTSVGYLALGYLRIYLKGSLGAKYVLTTNRYRGLSLNKQCPTTYCYVVENLFI